MKKSIESKLNTTSDRYQELQRLLSDPDVITNNKKFAEYSKEYSEIEPIVKNYQEYKSAILSQKNSQELMQDSDKEIKELAELELVEIQEKIENLEQDLQILLLPKDPNDTRNIYLEVRAGAGGDEAAIFVGDLFRAYLRYAENKGWRVQIMNKSESEQGGFKEIIAKIEGQNVYGDLKFESGAHRVQRVPATESQGRIHTSTCTVAVLPEVEIVDDVDINPADLRIDTFRASGAGGQHVNKTESAIRVTHIPTGTVVECQDDRSQHKNRERALSILKSRILAEEQSKQLSKVASDRKSLVGSGDRSERIRTYNYPQGRVTDHRINLTLYKLDQVMEGSLDEIIIPLHQEEQAGLLTEIGNDN